MSTDIESQARELGWRPKDEFTGNPDKWVSAEQFVANGENIAPYLRADRQKLFKTVDGLRQQIAQQEAIIRANNESIEALKKVTTTQTVERLQNEVKDLRQQLVAARKDGNVELEVDLETRLEEKRDEVREARTEATRTPIQQNSPDASRSTQGYVNTPEFQQFLSDNPWFQEDQVMAAAAVALMQSRNADPEFRSKTPAQRFASVAQDIKTRFGVDGGSGERRTDKVEGGRTAEPPARRGGSGSRAKTYHDLSPEARAVCDRQAKRLVGPKGSGRAFETLDAWRAHYAATVEE